MRAGLIHNPRSQRNRRGDDLRIPAELPYAALATPAELLDVLCKFAAQGIDLLIVSGGDGTLREVTSQLPQAYGTRLPKLALLAAGNANVVAADVGTAGYGSGALEQLLNAARDDCFRRREIRPLLRVRWPDLDVPPVLGFVAGAAVLTRATRHANEKVLTHGEIGRAHVCTPVTNAPLVCRLLLEKKNNQRQWRD